MNLRFKEATKEDVHIIVEMLADDDLGSKREDFKGPLAETYYKAFESINEDKNNKLMIALHEDKIIGTLQLTFIPYLTFKGGTRAQVEAVRIHKDHRGKGLGKLFFEWAIKEAKDRGCHLVQLTTNKQRDKAKDFYGALGFESTHEGMKLYLKPWGDN